MPPSPLTDAQLSGAQLSDDPTLDEVRAALAPHIASEAAFDGWTDLALENAARAQGIDPAVARLAFPGGAPDMIHAWIAAIDTDMAVKWPSEKLAGLKIRERIATLVTFRFEAVAGEREALRRAQAILAMPKNAAGTAKRAWKTADAMWRLAGDTATDYNHYTKRAILAGVYSSTMLVFVDDESDNYAETRAFLDRRIGNVMQFEKAKGAWVKRKENLPSLTRFLGRLRYPAR